MIKLTKNRVLLLGEENDERQFQKYAQKIHNRIRNPVLPVDFYHVDIAVLLQQYRKRLQQVHIRKENHKLFG